MKYSWSFYIMGLNQEYSKNFTKHLILLRQWSMKSWRFEEWFVNILESNIIRCNKLATNVSRRKNVAQPFFRRKQVSTSAEMSQQRTKPYTMTRFKFVFGFILCCYLSALLTCFRLEKGRATFFWPETIVASFLHLMVLSFKVLWNQ